MQKVPDTQSDCVRSSKRPAPCRAFGFTIIELIVIIALLGILSATAISRFGNVKTFTDLQLKDQLISMARVAQQTALNRHDQAVTLELSRPGNWLFEIKANGLSLKQQSVEAASADLTDPSDTAIGATPYVIAFDNLGNLAGGVVSNLPFTSSGQVVCISLAGYAYQAADRNACLSN